MRQRGSTLFLATQESLCLGNDVVAGIQFVTIFDLRAILAFVIDINRHRCTIVDGTVNDFGGNAVGYLTLNQATQRTCSVDGIVAVNRKMLHGGRSNHQVDTTIGKTLANISQLQTDDGLHCSNGERQQGPLLPV